MRLGITYNLKSDILHARVNSPSDDSDEEFDFPETIDSIKKVFEDEGHEVFLLGGDLTVLEKIKDGKIEFVFNIAEGFHGRSREAHIPALLEMAGIPYSGSDPLGLALTLDKVLTKRIAMSLNIPTPQMGPGPFQGQVQECKADLSLEKRGLAPSDFPLFLKPRCQGSSKGIRKSSRVNNAAEYEVELQRFSRDYPGEEVLVEEYIHGREFTVGVLGNKNPEILGMMEIAFRDPSRNDFCYSLEVKRDWKQLVEYHSPPKLDSTIQKEMENASLSLFETLGLRDVARFDFRVSPEGKFYFLEVNPLPGLNPESGDLVILAGKMGFNHRELILRIASAAFSRYPALSEVF